MITLETVLAEAQKNSRVYPQPQSWHQLYEMLPDKRYNGAGWDPPLPLILAAWWDTPAILKILRLREHLEWAASHDCLAEVFAFLTALPEEQWYHVGD